MSLKLGQPYAKVTLSTSETFNESRTWKGNRVAMLNSYPSWNINISYNSMPKEDFDVVYTFVLSRVGQYKPMDVVLPQHAKPGNTDFAQYMNTVPTIQFTGTPSAGATSFEINTTDWSTNDYSTTGLPEPGDFFNVFDPADTLHTKAYQVARVETYFTYQTNNRPASGSIRVHTFPALQRKPQPGATIIFNRPIFKMALMQDTIEYSIDTENLYNLKLSLREANY